jgi:uncharacterized protein
MPTWIGNIRIKRYWEKIMRLSQTNIQRVKKYFKDQPVRKAYLFGSHSRAMADIDSDVDILVELDHSTYPL